VAKITLTNGSATEPVIIGRGIQLGDDIINEIKNDITSSVQSGDLAALGAEAAKARIRKTIAKKLQKRMEKTPVIIVIAEI
jgi:mRNA degradation ribonuclease J1/J2